MRVSLICSAVSKARLTIPQCQACTLGSLIVAYSDMEDGGCSKGSAGVEFDGVLTTSEGVLRASTVY